MIFERNPDMLRTKSITSDVPGKRGQLPDYEGGSADHGMTLDEVGKALGVGRERVRQIEKQALRKLAQALHDRGFTAEDFLD